MWKTDTVPNGTYSIKVCRSLQCYSQWISVKQTVESSFSTVGSIEPGVRFSWISSSLTAFYLRFLMSKSNRLPWFFYLGARFTDFPFFEDIFSWTGCLYCVCIAHVWNNKLRQNLLEYILHADDKYWLYVGRWWIVKKISSKAFLLRSSPIRYFHAKTTFQEYRSNKG